MVRIYDTNRNRVVTQFFDMCASSSSTAENLYITFDTKLQELLENANPWGLCTSVGVDNTSVNIGVKDSINTRVQGRTSSILFSCAHAIYFIMQLRNLGMHFAIAVVLM